MNPNTTITKEGFHVLKNDTHISRWVEEHGNLICDPYLFKWLLPKIAGAKVIWDVGAFIGDHTAAYVSLPGVEKVHAFEPNPDAYYCLEKNLGDKARCWNVAASDRRDTLSMAPNENVGATRLSDAGTIKVPAVVLDRFMGNTPPPDFIKIDVEGWEMHALRGMKKTIDAHKPKVFIEVNSGALAANGNTAGDIFHFFAERGYTRYTIHPESTPKEAPQYDIFFQP